jgi:DNA-binding transcriptional ArsR family regulator
MLFDGHASLLFSSTLGGRPILQLLSSLFGIIRPSRGGDGSDPSSSGPGGGRGGYIDPRFKRVLWYLIGSTKGGANRAKIIRLLNERPANPNQLSTALNLDYKTILHHLKILSENGLVITDEKDKYGATYFLTPLMENNYASFSEILDRIKDS